MVWKNVPGFSCIEASDSGLIRIKETCTYVVQSKRSYYRCTTPKIAAQYRDPKTGYFTCGVKNDVTGKTRPVGVHRLVCLAFHGLPPKGKPNALHRDDVKFHNNESNLYWGSHKDNELDKRKNGNSLQGARHHATIFTNTEVQLIRARYKPKSRRDGAMAIALEYGVHRTTIENIVSGRTWGIEPKHAAVCKPARGNSGRF